MRKKIIAFLLAAVLAASLLPAAAAVEPGLRNFTASVTYPEGKFTDVPAGVWFESNVKAAYEMGLVAGATETTFDPEGYVTIAQAITFAARLHSIYHTGSAGFEQGSPWYQVYVDYAVENGIIAAGGYADYNANATRADCALILSASVPADALSAINSVTYLPDVTDTSGWGEAVFLLYRAGVLSGNDEYGTFAPNSYIQRSEIAAIVTRIADPALRRVISLPVAPESLMLSRDKTTLLVGNSFTAEALVEPFNAYDHSVTWTSSNPAAVTIDASGLVTAVAPGSATITATTVNGITATFPVEVIARTGVWVYRSSWSFLHEGRVNAFVSWGNTSGKVIDTVDFCFSAYDENGSILSCEETGKTEFRASLGEYSTPTAPAELEPGHAFLIDENILASGGYGGDTPFHDIFSNYPPYYQGIPYTYVGRVYMATENVAYACTGLSNSDFVNERTADVKLTRVILTYEDGTAETIENPPVGQLVPDAYYTDRYYNDFLLARAASEENYKLGRYMDLLEGSLWTTTAEDGLPFMVKEENGEYFVTAGECAEWLPFDPELDEQDNLIVFSDAFGLDYTGIRYRIGFDGSSRDTVNVEQNDYARFNNADYYDDMATYSRGALPGYALDERGYFEYLSGGVWSGDDVFEVFESNGEYYLRIDSYELNESSDVYYFTISLDPLGRAILSLPYYRDDGARMLITPEGEDALQMAFSGFLDNSSGFFLTPRVNVPYTRTE